MKGEQETSSSSNTKLSPYLGPIGAIALSFGFAVGWGSFIKPVTIEKLKGMLK